MEYPSLDKPIAGAIRFNTDSSQLEIYDGNQWTGLIGNPSVNVTRAIFAGGGSTSNVMQYVNIPTTGDAVDFGDLTLGRSWLTAACGNRTRGYWAGGYMTPTPMAAGGYVVGERGPELFMPRVGGKILNTDRTRDLLDGQRSGAITGSGMVNQLVVANLIADKSVSKNSKISVDTFAGVV